MIDIYLKCSVKEESRARIGDISDQEGVRAPFEQREINLSESSPLAPLLKDSILGLQRCSRGRSSFLKRF